MQEGSTNLMAWKMEIPHRVLLLLLLPISFAIAQNAPTEEVHEFHVGVILDLGSMVGKIARTSISLAMEDFYAVHQNYSTKIVLHIRDSMSDDVQAASEGTCSELLSQFTASAYSAMLLKMH
jgi:ionotropic glutamate receptor